MNPPPSMAPIDWAKRINRSWIVRSDLNKHADAWLEHLAALDDGRLLESCRAARDMCHLRERADDPKPWFYAGLFHLATAPEARRFLETHRVTKAAIPSMVDDESVRLWLDRVGPETHELIARLRSALHSRQLDS
jgi:hypothetical protein